jgi:microcystin-dependent protein
VAEPYVGEIRIFCGTYAPVGWMFCDGQIVPIGPYQALFQLIGTTYGGDGNNNFGLPDLRSRVPIHQGNGFVMGQPGGSEAVTLNTQEVPLHNHGMMASAGVANSANAAGNVLARSPQVKAFINGTPTVAMAPQFLTPYNGASLPHSNIQPYLGVTCIISMFGLFPSQG